MTWIVFIMYLLPKFLSSSSISIISKLLLLLKPFVENLIPFYIFHMYTIIAWNDITFTNKAPHTGRYVEKEPISYFSFLINQPSCRFVIVVLFLILYDFAASTYLTTWRDDVYILTYWVKLIYINTSSSSSSFAALIYKVTLVVFSIDLFCGLYYCISLYVLLTSVLFIYPWTLITTKWITTNYKFVSSVTKWIESNDACRRSFSDIV